MKKFLITLLAATLFYGAVAQTEKGFAVQRKVKQGIVEGNYQVSNGVQTFFGIPFAQPPVGNLRWKAPLPAKSWTGVLETKQFKDGPVQGIVFGDMKSRGENFNEDCLYLNVWTPAKANQKGLPVLVYFYGGGFVAGDASEPRYDGEAMAQKGIVAVTCNYRLNIFGFFSHPELSKEAPYKGSGNYGLLDQVAALKWVKENIASFGGDPDKVTIAGESAGSISVSAQMASPLARGLFRGAIGESGAAINPTLAPVSLAEAEKQGLEFAEKIGKKTLAQLRAMSTQELFEAYQESRRFGFPTTIDGYFYKITVPESYYAGKHNDVSLLVGWNSAEIPGAAFMFGKPFTSENFVAQAKMMYPKNADEVLKLYPHTDSAEVEWSATELASDRFISYSTWKWFQLQREYGTKPVYRYLFSRVRPSLKDAGLQSGFAGGTQRQAPGAPVQRGPIGAAHAVEIEYAMGNLHRSPEYDWQPDDKIVSETMLNYFANFIKNGNPNGDKLPNWPAAKRGEANTPVMIIDKESKAINSVHENRYLFHDQFYGNGKK